MGKANLYTVKDYQAGEVLAKGTAGELEASGIVPKGYHTSEWAKHENQKRRNRKYAVTFEERQPEVKRGEKGRMMSVYTCYNAAGDVIGEGTAQGNCGRRASSATTTRPTIPTKNRAGAA